MRRDHDWWGTAGQAQLGIRRKGHRVGNPAMQRSGERVCRSCSERNRKGNRIVGLVRAHTRPGSLFYTDEWHAYGSLRVLGDHVVIRKGRGHFPLVL